jgi:integrating conjugative element protein (TIGR03758 family)
MSAAQISAFAANGGFPPSIALAVFLAGVFAVVLLWGVCAMYAAYTGWAEQRLSERQAVGVVVRVVTVYTVLTFVLL